jgi:hypothetical protein
MRRGVAAVVAAAVVGAIVAVVVVASPSHARLAGSNGVEASAFNTVVADGREYCQTVFLPAHADRIRMTVGSYDKPTPAIDVTIKGPGGRTIARHRTAGGFRQGVATFALGATTAAPVAAARLCLRPDGTKIALAGAADGARVEFLRPGRESYFAIAGTMLHRFGLGKPDWQGAWLGFVAIALLVAVWALTARVMLREGDGT